MKVIPTMIDIRKTALLAAVTLAVTVVSCQKDVDYSPPPDAGSFEKDKTTAFGHITEDDGATWAWDAKAGLFANKFGGMMVQFFKDSTANIYGTPLRGLRTDLLAIRASGTLVPEEIEVLDQLVEILDEISPRFSETQIRLLLDDPANEDLKWYFEYFLPNYEYFNSLTLSREEGLSFDVNGPVQISLTFHNSVLLGSLKQSGTLDFDFRLMKTSSDSLSLDGYFTDDANKQSKMYKTPLTIPEAFATSSRSFIELNPTRANVSIRSGGANVPRPPGYVSGLDYFYNAFNQTFTVKDGWGYVPNGTDANLAPVVLRTARMVTVKSAYAGTALTAPAGTVLATMTVINTDGSTKDIDFVKN